MWPNQIFLRLVRSTIFCLILASASVVFSQSLSFTYQGRLDDGGAPANGNYDLEFRMFADQSGGTALSTEQRLNVVVSAGVFTVTLVGDTFTGARRFLEIAVKPVGGSTFITLNPRQQITSTPYAIRSLSAGNADTAMNALQLGGIAGNQYVLTGDARLTDARPPTAGSSNYIQNTTSPQASSNFNISGNGTIGGNLVANGRVGIGRTTLGAKLDVLADAGTGVLGESGSGFGVHGASNSGVGVRGQANSGIAVYGSSGGLAAQFDGRVYVNGNLGIDINPDSFKLHVSGETRTNTLSIDNYVSNSGGPTLCASTSTNRVGLCSSSLRYKTKVHSFRSGLDVVNRLRPISFTWKESAMHDVGLAAEEVDKVAPLLTFRNNNGEVEGVKYNLLSAVFINAFKEQQEQIYQQQDQLKQQRSLIEQQAVLINDLRRLVCRRNARAAICRR